MEKKEQKFTLGAAINNLERLAEMGKSLTKVEDKKDPDIEPDFANMKSTQAQNIAQWAIDNRYPHEFNKVADFEYYIEIAESIQKHVEQERNRAISECISRVKNQLLSRSDTNNLILELEKLKK